MRIRILLVIALATLALTGCRTATENNLSYFRNMGDAPTGVMPQGTGYEIKIAPEDELSIVVSSAVPQATAMFNQPQANVATRGELTTQPVPRLQTYIVDRQGDIIMPQLGKINVAGKTTSEIEDLIRSRVSATVNDPFVRVQLVGFYVIVMGEVKTPQRIQVTSQRFTLLDALSAAGSPYFYLQQNDVVYVEPNQIRIDNSKYNQNNAFKLSVISTIVSATSVVASLIIALAVK